MEAVELTEEKFKKWKRKRLTTFIIFWVLYFWIGIFANLFRTTCFLYVKTHFETGNPDLFLCNRYSVFASSYVYIHSIRLT